MAATFELYKDKAGKHRWRLKAANGEIIFSGQGYVAKASCLNGVESVKTNCVNDDSFEVKESSDGRGYFVREKRFRLNQDGTLYDIPVTSDASRYSEVVTTDPTHDSDRIRLQKIINDFMAIEPQYNNGSTDSRKKKERTKKKP